MGSVQVLDLLHALTEADSAATGPAAWSAWKGQLVGELVRRTRALLGGDEPAPPTPLAPWQQELVGAGELALEARGEEVTVVAPDRPGLLSAAAGVLALHRLDVRSAWVGTRGSTAVTVFRVAPRFGDLPDWAPVRDDLRAALDGRLALGEQLASREAAYRRADPTPPAPPTVTLVDDASDSATVVEVRAPDGLGVLHRITAALHREGLDIRSAHVSSLGADLVDAFYVQGLDDPQQRERVVQGVLAALRMRRAAERRSARGVGVVQAAGQADEQPPGDRRGAVEQGEQLALLHDEQGAGGGHGDRGAAGPAVEDGELAEPLPGLERRDLRAVAGDGGRAVDQHVELVARLALADDDLALAGVRALGHLVDLGELLVVERGEQRHAGELLQRVLGHGGPPGPSRWAGRAVAESRTQQPRAGAAPRLRPMFDTLSDRLDKVFTSLRGKGRLSDADIDATAREIRIALLEADVALPVVKAFIAAVKERARGAEVSGALNPAQQVIKIVNEELVGILGGQTRLVRYAKTGPTVIMLAGLQGAGKTTLAGKLGLWLKAQGHAPLLVACDLQRPNAVQQLQVVGGQAGVDVFAPYEGSGVGDPVDAARRGLEHAARMNHDVVVVDTAGRLGIDAELMQQAADIRAAVQPDEVLFVVDAMIGQDAVVTAQAFQEGVGFTGVVLTKLDGDARGGAALSVRHLTGQPILFASTGEKLKDFDVFHPERMASRILGMGDVLTLIEQAERTFDQDTAERMAGKMMEGKDFDLEDFLEQMVQVKKMGSITSLLGMLPGMGQMKDALAQVKDSDIDRIAAIIRSMTPQERRDPKVLNGSRRSRIAKGSGVTVTEVNSLVDRFHEAQKMMKQMGGLPGMPGAGGSRAAKRAGKKGGKKKGPGRAGGGPSKQQQALPQGLPQGLPQSLQQGLPQGFPQLPGGRSPLGLPPQTGPDPLGLRRPR